MRQSFFILTAMFAAAPAAADEMAVWLHLSFTEVKASTGLPVSNPNGKIEPGEAAKIHLSVSFAPPVGSAVTPANLRPGASLPPGDWVVHAFMGSYALGVGTDSGNPGIWRDPTLAPGWDTGWAERGYPENFAIRGVMPRQEAQGADQSNPVMVWHCIWQPLAYTDRLAEIVVGPIDFGGIGGALWLHDESSPGSFTTAGYRTWGGTLHIPISAGCYADCDTNGTLNIDDFICFVNEFAIAQTFPPAQQYTSYANCDGSSLMPILTIDDFLCFIDAFAQGCP